MLASHSEESVRARYSPVTEASGRHARDARVLVATPPGPGWGRPDDALLESRRPAHQDKQDLGKYNNLTFNFDFLHIRTIFQMYYIRNHFSSREPWSSSNILRGPSARLLLGARVGCTLGVRPPGVSRSDDSRGAHSTHEDLNR